MGEQGLVRFGISIPKELLERFDTLVEEKGYANRSEAIRDLMRKALVEREHTDAERIVAGTITLIYDHHIQRINDKLNQLQHTEYDLIISTLHVHLDAHNCMEVIVLKGAVKRIREMADTLISSRGVKHGKLILTSTGSELA